MDVQVRVIDPFTAPMVLTCDTEEEKKVIVAMLAKLYISANSKTDKLQSTIELVAEAIDDKIAQDAASRNALNKLHSALSKVLKDADKVTPAEADGLIDVLEQKVEASSLGNGENARMAGVSEDGVTEAHDFLVE